MENDKCTKINFMKLVVTIFVVIAHVTRMYTGYGAISGYNINNFLKLVTEFIYGFHMPLFFVLSGLVFSICIERGKYKDKYSFIKNKFVRLMIPYFIFGIFYVSPVLMALKLTNLNIIQCIIRNILLCQDSRHLWFLTTLFGIFLLTLFINPKSKFQSFVAVIISILLAFVSNYLPDFIDKILSYSVFFYLGIFINYIYKEINEKKHRKYITSIILILVYCIFFILK